MNTQPELTCRVSTALPQPAPLNQFCVSWNERKVFSWIEFMYGFEAVGRRRCAGWEAAGLGHVHFAIAAQGQPWL